MSLKPEDFARCRRDARPGCVLCRGLGVVETVHPDDRICRSLAEFTSMTDSPTNQTFRKVQRVCECVK